MPPIVTIAMSAIGRNVRMAAATRGFRLAQINAQTATPASASAAR